MRLAKPAVLRDGDGNMRRRWPAWLAERGDFGGNNP
jgi:hypothetical protein